MKLRYTRRAVDDLEAIEDYYGPLSPKGTSNLFAAIRKALNDIAALPHAGRSTEIPEVRCLVVRPILIKSSIG